jgi:GNAT superfamily N-acetyltransferase
MIKYYEQYKSSEEGIKIVKEKLGNHILEYDDTDFLYAVEDTEVVGISMTVYDKKIDEKFLTGKNIIYLAGIFVEESHRGQSIGSNLLDKRLALAEKREATFDCMYSKVRIKSNLLQKYLDYGFIILGYESNTEFEWLLLYKELN